MRAELVEARPSTGAVLSLSKGSGRISHEGRELERVLIRKDRREWLASSAARRPVTVGVDL
jgi:hypothetical protein